MNVTEGCQFVLRVSAGFKARLFVIIKPCWLQKLLKLQKLKLKLQKLATKVHLGWKPLIVGWLGLVW